MSTREEQMQSFGRLLDVLDELREKCPWDRKQTNESLRPNTIEEVYELCDALIQNDKKNICKELGDVLLHVVFYAKIAEEKEEFDIADCLRKICDKMRFRHPHVFGDESGKTLSAKEIADTWELIKAKEKGGNKTVMGGIPQTMPALLKAMSMQEKARGCGFDWEEPRQVLDKVNEELLEVKEAIDEKSQNHMEEEFGDLMFSVINAARLHGIDPEKALNRCCDKFRRRFTYLEENTIKKGLNLKDMSLEDMDKIWNEAKSKGL